MSSRITEPRSNNTLYFDPDEHPDNTLKAFNEFIETFELRYDAQFPDPPKVSLDSAIERWKYIHGTEENPYPRPTLEQYDHIKEEWRSKDRLARFLGMFSSSRMYSDWQVAIPTEKARKEATWTQFVTTMRQFYMPTQNPTLSSGNFHNFPMKHLRHSATVLKKKLDIVFLNVLIMTAALRK